MNGRAEILYIGGPLDGESRLHPLPAALPPLYKLYVIPLIHLDQVFHWSFAVHDSLPKAEVMNRLRQTYADAKGGS